VVFFMMHYVVIFQPIIADSLNYTSLLRYVSSL
jgi:hypothetical protein